MKSKSLIDYELHIKALEDQVCRLAKEVETLRKLNAENITELLELKEAIRKL